MCNCVVIKPGHVNWGQCWIAAPPHTIYCFHHDSVRLVNTLVPRFICAPRFWVNLTITTSLPQLIATVVRAMLPIKMTIYRNEWKGDVVNVDDEGYDDGDDDV